MFNNNFRDFRHLVGVCGRGESWRGLTGTKRPAEGGLPHFERAVGQAALSRPFGCQGDHASGCRWNSEALGRELGLSAMQGVMPRGRNGRPGRPAPLRGRGGAGCPQPPVWLSGGSRFRMQVNSVALGRELRLWACQGVTPRGRNKGKGTLALTVIRGAVLLMPRRHRNAQGGMVFHAINRGNCHMPIFEC